MLHHFAITKAVSEALFTGIYPNLHLLTRCVRLRGVVPWCDGYGIYLCVREIKRVCVRARDRGNMFIFKKKKMLANVELSLVVETPSVQFFFFFISTSTVISQMTVTVL